MTPSTFYRQIKMMLGIGRVTGMSDSGLIQTLQYKTAMEVRSGTPRMAEFGFSSAPPVGSDVLIASIGGDRSNAVVIATNHQGSRPTGLLYGESMVYNEWGLFIKFTETGIEIDANSQPVTVNNATTVTINATEKVVMNTPTLEVSGDIIDNSSSNSVTLKQLRDAYNEHDHPVEGIETGNSEISTGTTSEAVK